MALGGAWGGHGGGYGGFGRCAIERRTCPKAPMGPQVAQERLMTTPLRDPKKRFFFPRREENQLPLKNGYEMSINQRSPHVRVGIESSSRKHPFYPVFGLSQDPRDSIFHSFWPARLAGQRGWPASAPGGVDVGSPWVPGGSLGLTGALGRICKSTPQASCYWKWAVR